MALSEKQTMAQSYPLVHPQLNSLIRLGISPYGRYERSQSPISFFTAFVYISTPYSEPGKIVLMISQVLFPAGKVPKKENVIPFPELLKAI